MNSTRSPWAPDSTEYSELLGGETSRNHQTYRLIKTQTKVMIAVVSVVTYLPFLPLSPQNNLTAALVFHETSQCIVTKAMCFCLLSLEHFRHQI